MPDNSDVRRQRRAQAIAELLDEIAQPIVARAGARGLTPAQRAALRYLGRAEETASTVAALAAFHATARSNAARTVDALIRKGLIIKISGPDNRQRALALTSSGHRALKEDPVVGLAAELRTLSDDQLLHVAEALETLAPKVLAKG